MHVVSNAEPYTDTIYQQLMFDEITRWLAVVSQMALTRTMMIGWLLIQRERYEAWLYILRLD